MKEEQMPLNKEQQEVLKLLKEIDTICRKYQIEYYLSPKLTLHAVTGNPMPGSPLAGAVVMKLPDMERFRKVMETELPDRRVLESMKDNKRFPGLFLRYENTDTLCLRLNEGRNFQHPGIGVDIIPLRAGKAPAKVRSWDRRLETGWVQTCDRGRSETNFYRFVCGCWVRIAGIFGREKLGGRIYDRLCKNQDTDGAKRYRLQWNRDTEYVYPADVFEETKEIVMEGEKFLIPGREDVYLSKTFGADYESRISDKNKMSLSLIVSTQVSCDDFLRENGSLKKLVKARRRQFLADNYVKRYKDYFDWCWNYAKYCAARRELVPFYEDKKEYIRHLWEEKDYARLGEELKPFGKMMMRSLNRDEICDVDEEILEIFLEYLGAVGKVRLRARIEGYRN